MKLTTEQSKALLARFRCYVTQVCDKCGKLLGPVFYTRKGEAGEWCSRECRGDVVRVPIRRGGRPRKYRSNAEKQSAYRARRGCYETPLQLATNKELVAAKIGSHAV